MTKQKPDGSFCHPAFLWYNEFALERECQRHLYLPRGADGMGDIAKAGGAVIEAFIRLVAASELHPVARAFARGRGIG